MNINPATGPVAADLPATQSQAPTSEIPTPAELAQDQSGQVNPNDLRLVIEDDKAAGTLVYKSVDWRTGEVVQQLPREQVLQLLETQNYAAGQLISSKA
jgi:flagellar protein FlaG